MRFYEKSWLEQGWETLKGGLQALIPATNMKIMTELSPCSNLACVNVTFLAESTICAPSSFSTLKASRVLYKQALQHFHSQASWKCSLASSSQKEDSKEAFAFCLLPLLFLPWNSHSTQEVEGDHEEITYYVLYRVSVNGDHANGGCPFVVLLVNVLVQEGQVNKPK